MLSSPEARPGPAATLRLALTRAGGAVRRFGRTPKGLMLLVLLALLALAAPAAGLAQTVPGLLLAVGAAMLLDLVLAWLAQGRWSLPIGALLTGLFVAMVLEPHESWPVLLATTVLAINSKWLVRTRWSNVFNPAAVGLVIAALLFGSAQSWWGALPDLPLPLIAVLIATAGFIAARLNKLPMLVVFLIAYTGLLTAAAWLGEPAGVAEMFRVPNVNAALFFGGFMLTDPPTSPVRYRDQVVYGIIVAVSAVAIFLTVGGVYFLPAGLLIGNLWESARRLTARRARGLATRA